MKTVDSQTFSKRLKIILLSHNIDEFVQEHLLQQMIENLITVAYAEGYFDLTYLDVYLRREYKVPPEKVNEILQDIQTIQEKLEIKAIPSDTSADQEEKFLELMKSASHLDSTKSAPPLSPSETQTDSEEEITLSKAISVVSAAEKGRLLDSNKIKCPRCGSMQPKSHRCGNCGLDIDGFYTLQNRYRAKETEPVPGDKRTGIGFNSKLLPVGLAVALLVVGWALYRTFGIGEKAAAVRPPVSTMKVNRVSSDQINLSWSCRFCNQKEYNIERKVEENGAYDKIAAVPADKTSYTDVGLMEGTDYCYRIFFQSYAKHYNIGCAVTLPAAPSGLSANAVSDSQIKISWKNNSNNADGILIEKKAGNTNTYDKVATLSFDATGFLDSNLGEGQTYCYRVYAYKFSEANLSHSEEICAKTIRNRPAPPTDLKAAISQGERIFLSWSDNSDNEEGFLVERRGGNESSYRRIKTLGPNETQCNVVAYPPGTEFRFRVQAYNASGESAYSNEIRVVTPNRDLNQPGTPSNDEDTGNRQERLEECVTRCYYYCHGNRSCMSQCARRCD